MAHKLSDTVIAARMVELRSLRSLHAHDRKQIQTLKADNKVLHAENQDLRQLVGTLQIQMAELQTMVFGRKQRPPTGTVVPVLPTPAKPPRTKASYRRPLPPANAITVVVPVAIPETCTCGGSFTITTHERYEEDIPLPELTTDYVAHLVTRYVIERGVCDSCGKVTSGRSLGGQLVSLGSNVHLLVAHLITVLGMSYGQVINLLLSLYGMYISKAELSAILTTKHQTWLPAYEQLKADIRAAPIVHADETPWPIQNNDHLGYAWILSDATTPKVCYALENSRGAKHAKSLIGDSFMGVRLSDDYGAYRSLPGSQQLCWVHLYRCIRDLRYNDNLPEEHLSYVNWWYEEFVTIYQQLKTCLAEVHEQNKRQAWAAKLWSQVRVLCQAHPEPVKLTKLKAQLLRAGKDKLFVCLLKDTPCDNNRAERDLRQLVLKRKRSFGSQTEKGTKVLATILSVCTTTWRLQPDSYFKALTQLG